MQIVNCDQNSHEWDEVRKYRLGASNATAIASCGKGLETLVREKVRKAISTGEEERYYGAAMANGHELEDSAAMVYSFQTGIEVQKVGYVIHSEHIGCSPDRLAGDDGLIEIKCPTDKVYFDLLIDGKVDSGYAWQMQDQMLICGKKWCDYVVYNPNFQQQLIIIRQLPDQKKFDKLLAGFEAGSKRMVELLEKYGVAVQS